MKRFFNILAILVYLSLGIAYGQTAKLTTDETLYEKTLDGRLLSIKLNGDTLADPTSLTVADFTLANFPLGIAITDTVFTSPDSVVLSISFNDKTDFDTDSVNAHVIISGSVLKVGPSDLSTDSISVIHFLETPAANLVPDSTLTELRLDARSLTIDLDEEKFEAYGSLVTGNFTLVNAPSGTSIEGVSGSNDTTVVINLAYTWSDFDSDYLNFAVRIDSLVLVQTETDYLETVNDTIFAFVEPPTATLAAGLDP